MSETYNITLDSQLGERLGTLSGGEKQRQRDNFTAGL